MNVSIRIFLIAVLLSLTGCGESKSSAPAAELHAEATTLDRVVIDPEAARNAGIAVSTAVSGSLKETLMLYGVVQPNAEHTRQVVARFPGVVKSVNKALGDHVNAGDVLATVESNDSLQTYSIKAPITGVIAARVINTGETITDQALFTLTDLSTVWVELSLFPGDRAHVQVGQAVSIHATQGGPAASGRIVWLSSVGSTVTQSLAARVELDNRQGLWTPGLYVVGDITLSEQSIALAVQSDAVQNLDGKTVIFTESNGVYQARQVKLGRSDGVLTEVLEGIALNEHYVSANSFVIKADIEKSSAAHHE